MGLFRAKATEESPEEFDELPEQRFKRAPEIDAEKRYDVYLLLSEVPPLVLRNVKFRGERRLPTESDVGGIAYALVEQEDGVEVYLLSIHIFAFCEHGSKPNVEVHDFGQ